MRTRIAPLIHALLASTSLAGAAAAQPTPRIEVAEASVTDLQNALTSGRATSVSLTRAYLARIEALVGVPIDVISTGPDRAQTIVRRDPFG